MHAHFGGLLLAEVKVGTAQFDELLEILVDDWHETFAVRGWVAQDSKNFFMITLSSARDSHSSRLIWPAA